MSVQSIGQCVVRMKYHLETISFEIGLNYIKTGILDKAEIECALQKISQEVCKCRRELDATEEEDRSHE